MLKTVIMLKPCFLYCNEKGQILPVNKMDTSSFLFVVILKLLQMTRENMRGSKVEEHLPSVQETSVSLNSFSNGNKIPGLS